MKAKKTPAEAAKLTPAHQCVLGFTAEDMDMLNAAFVALRQKCDRTMASLQAQINAQVSKPKLD